MISVVNCSRHFEKSLGLETFHNFFTYVARSAVPLEKNIVHIPTLEFRP